MCAFNYNIGFIFKILIVLVIPFPAPIFSYGQSPPMQIEGRLSLQLKKDVFIESYQLVLRKDGVDDVNDADALQLSEGFVSLAGLTTAGSRLAVEERRADTSAKIIRLYSKGSDPGQYSLCFRASPGFFDAYQVRLSDHYRQVFTEIKDTATVYTFFSDAKMAPEWAASRFSLFVKARMDQSARPPARIDALQVYPNPFQGSIYVNTHAYTQEVLLKMRNLMGQNMLTRQLDIQKESYEIPTTHFAPGVYLLELFDQKTGLRIKTLKLVKQ